MDIFFGGNFNIIFNTDLESDGGNSELKLSSIDHYGKGGEPGAV